MFIIEAHIDEVLLELPLVREWVDTIKNSILKKDFPDSKIIAYYSYGFFVTKSNSQVDYLKMPYSERLEFEKSKVRVDISLKMGKFAMSNRLPKEMIPPFIEEIVAEIVKIKMTVETEIEDIYEIKDTIPPLTGVVQFDIIEELEDETQLDMDEILDKISREGMSSLSSEEKEFLDRKSKDV
jgi:hypothetical protein